MTPYTCHVLLTLDGMVPRQGTKDMRWIGRLADKRAELYRQQPQQAKQETRRP